MSVDPHTPVIVGVGQVTNRPGADGGGLDSRPEPIGLMVQAVQAAMEDCDGAEPGGSAPAGRRLVDRTQSLRLSDPLSWRYLNPGRAVATSLGI